MSLLLSGKQTVTGGGTGGTGGGGTGGGGTGGATGGTGGSTGTPGVTGTGLETLVWIEPDGTATALIEANGVIVNDGPFGRFLAPTDLTEDVAAGLDGSLLRNVRAKARVLTVPLTFVGDDRLDVRAVARTWARRFTPGRGDGTLRLVLGDGTSRDLTKVRYNRGFDGDETRAVSSANHMALAVELRAMDPYFYDTSDVARLVAGGNQTGFFPMLPLHLSQGAIGTANIIENDGDAPAWPVWVVQGPGTGITISNQTTGDTLSLPTLALAAGQSLTIDTRPLVKAVVREDGSNQYARLTSTSSMWALIEGKNSVLVTVGGSAGTTVVTLQYRRRWLTA